MAELQTAEPEAGLFGASPDYRKGYEQAASVVRNHVEMSQKEAAIIAEQNKQAKKSPFKKFTQINNAQLDAVGKMSVENPVAAQIYWFLTKHMSTTNAVACPQSLLQELTGKSEPTIWRAIKYLQSHQFIGIAKVGTANVYHMNTRVVWHSDADNLRFAEMSASILLNVKENPKLKVNVGRVNHLQQIELDLEP